MIDQSRIKKILVVLPNWIGDAVMSAPAISQIRERLPSARITIVGLPHISELFYESPYVDEIKMYQDRSQKSEVRSKKANFVNQSIRALLTAISDIRKCRFDMALLLPNSFRSALLVRLAGIPLRCGYNRDARGFLLTMQIRLTPQIKRLHQVEYYLHLVNSISPLSNKTDRTSQVTKENENTLPVDWGSGGRDRVGMGFPGITHPHLNPLPEGEEIGMKVFSAEYQGKIGALLYLSKDEIQQAREILAKNHITPDDLLIGINPGATYGSSKRWYPERFSQVAAALVKKHHARVILFGGPGERDIAEEIIRASGPSLFNMSGQTTIRGLMALLSQCRLLITNDSGPMHIAAALGVPVVAIFGSTDPALTTPIGTGHVLIRKDVPCSPCFRRECPTDLKCMDLIHVEDVLGGVEKILGR